MLTILVTSVTGVGHINACVGATTELLLRGHRVIFVLEAAWAGKLTSLGFEEFLYSETGEGEISGKLPGNPEKVPEKPGEAMAKYLLESKTIGPYSPAEKMKQMTRYFKSPANRRKFGRFNAAIEAAIAAHRPDLIYVDGGLRPAVRASGRPWIVSFSGNPLFLLVDPQLPPGGFGLPTDSPPSSWTEARRLQGEILHSSDYNDLIEELGYARYPGDAITPLEEASLVVYGFPAEIDYPPLASKGWFNLEVFNRAPEHAQKTPLRMLLPERFMEQRLKGRKLIYISMGSMGSVDLKFMRRLVGVLGHTEHAYVVSKGPRHEELELPGNMFGDRFLPQRKLLPHVDLVISHGGANTVTETLVEGKPLLLLPLFADQYDTAQRVAHECQLALTLDAYAYTDTQLTGAIECLLYDHALWARLMALSERIKRTDRHRELADTIEQRFMVAK